MTAADAEAYAEALVDAGCNCLRTLRVVEVEDIAEAMQEQQMACNRIRARVIKSVFVGMVDEAQAQAQAKCAAPQAHTDDEVSVQPGGSQGGGGRT